MKALKMLYVYKNTGPRGLPLLGYAPFLSSWDPKYPHKALKKLSDVYGPVTAIYLGLSPPIISVCGHEAVKEALFNEDLNGRPQVASTLGRTFWEQLGKSLKCCCWNYV